MSGALAFTHTHVVAHLSGNADGGFSLVQALLLDSPNAETGCEEVASNQTLNINVAAPEGGSVGTGAYSIDGVDHDVTYIDLGNFEFLSAGSGTITLSTVREDRLAGSFDVVMELPDGGTGMLSGSFDAPACP